MMMKFSFFVLQAAAALTAVAAAGIRRDNSSSCTTVLQGLVTSSDPTLGCLAPSALKDVFALGGSSNSTPAAIESTLNTWFTDFCGVGTCSSDTINKISAAVDTPCGVEFNMTDYTQLRELLCLKDTTTNTFCTIETIASGGNDTDTTDDNTTNSDPGEILLGIFLSATTFFTPCNECAKAQYQLSVQLGGSADTSTLDHCGANFTSTLNSTLVGVKQVGVTSEFKANAARALAPTAGLFLLTMAGFVVLL